MKEEWIKYDENGKIFTKLNKAETVPIHIEFPLVADYVQPNYSIYKKVFVTIKVLILLVILVFLCWMSVNLYRSYFSKSMLNINSTSGFAYNSQIEKASLKSNFYANDFSLVNEDSEDSENDSEKSENDSEKSENGSEKSENDLKLESSGEELFNKWLHSLNAKDLFDVRNPRLIADLKKLLDDPEESDNDPTVLLTKLILKYRSILEPYIKYSLNPGYQGVEINETESDYNFNDSTQTKLDYVGFQPNFLKDDDDTTINTSTDNINEEYSFPPSDKKFIESNVFNSIHLNHLHQDDDKDKRDKWEENLKLADPGYYILKKSIKIYEQIPLYFNYETWKCKILENESLARQMKLLEFMKLSKSRYSINMGTDSEEEQQMCEEPRIDENANDTVTDLDWFKDNIVDDLVSASQTPYIIAESDLYVLVAREFEKLEENYFNFLIWYYENRNNKDWQGNSKLSKGLAAELLFSPDIDNYLDVNKKVLNLLQSSTQFYDNYVKLLDGKLSNLKPETKSQYFMVDNLILKSTAEKLKRWEIINSKYIKMTIKNVNWRKLKNLIHDPYILMGGSDENIDNHMLIKNVGPTARIYDILLLMSKRLDALIGKFVDLLTWYYKNQNKPDTKKDTLKILAANLLFDRNIFQFYNQTAELHKVLISDPEYLKGYKQILNGTMTKLKIENNNQYDIVSRLVIKMTMKRFEGISMTSFEIAKKLDDSNWNSLKLAGLDLQKGKDFPKSDNWKELISENKSEELKEPLEENSREYKSDSDKGQNVTLIEVPSTVSEKSVNTLLINKTEIITDFKASHMSSSNSTDRIANRLGENDKGGNIHESSVMSIYVKKNQTVSTTQIPSNWSKANFDLATNILNANRLPNKTEIEKQTSTVKNPTVLLLPEEISVDEATSEEISMNQATTEEISGDEATSKEISMNKAITEEISADEPTSDKITEKYVISKKESSTDEISDREGSGDRISDEEGSGDVISDEEGSKYDFSDDEDY